jgi:uncharacterized protein
MGGTLEFEWDPAKARANLRKHRVPFIKACEVFRDTARSEHPDVFEDEERWMVLGRVEQTILAVVYAERNDRIRIISARKATIDEQKIYWHGHIPS